MDHLPSSSLISLRPGDAAALNAEAQLKLSRAALCESPLEAAKLEAEANGLQALAKQLRDPPANNLPQLCLGRGGEVSPLPTSSMPLVMREIAGTIQSPPDVLTAEASMGRLALARDAGVLTEATDAAESIGAESAIEQMLVHEIAAAHRVGMKLMAAADTALRTHEHERLTKGDGAALAQASRSALAAARLMDSVTRTASALDRMRNGGRQHVTVEHMVVEDGGQAVVAGSIGREGNAALGARRGRGRGAR